MSPEQLAPYLQDLTSTAILFVVITITVFIKMAVNAIIKHYGLQNDQLVRTAMLQIASQAGSYGKFQEGKTIAAAVAPPATPAAAVAVPAVDPAVAAGVDFFVNHAANEIAHFNLSHDDIVRIVEAFIPKAQPEKK